MKLEESCGATDVCDECALHECRRRMLRSNECLWRMLRSNECALHESLRLHVRLKQDNTWKT